MAEWSLERPQRGNLSAEPGFTPGEAELIDSPSEDAAFRPDARPPARRVRPRFNR